MITNARPSLRTGWHALTHPLLRVPLQRRLYPLLFYTLLTLLGIDLLGLVFSLAGYLSAQAITPTQQESLTISQALYVAIGILCAVGLWLAHRGSFQGAALLLAAGLLVVQTLGIVATNLIGGALFLPCMLAAIVFAGLMLDWRLATLLGIGASVIVGGIASVEIGQRIVVALTPDQASEVIFTNAFVFVCEVIFVLVVVIIFRRALQNELQATLNRESDLRIARDSLQGQVETRTSELQQALSSSTARANELAQTVAALERSEATVQQLNAPIIPVVAGVLLVPLVGAFGNDRVAALTARVLEAVETNRCRKLIIDLTGVAVLDTDDVTAIIQIAHAAKLMGSVSVLVGLSPEVVQNLVALHVDMRFSTFATLEQAITTIITRPGPQSAAHPN